MEEQQQRAAWALDIIAAVATMLAADIRACKLWPGEITQRLKTIHEALKDVKEPQ